MRRARRAAARIGPPAADLRGAARRVPVRRRRFERRRRDDGRRFRRARSTPARSRSPTRRSTSRLTRRQVAARYGTRHFVERVESDDFDLIDTLARLYDEPYADSSAIPDLPRLPARAQARDGRAVGRRRRRELRRLPPLPAARRRRSGCARRCRSSMRRPLFGLLGRAYPKADWAPRVFRAKSTFEALARDSVEAYFHSDVDLPRRHAARSCSAPRSSASSAATTRIEVFRRHAARAGTDDPLALVQYLDLKTYLVGDINTKVDRASMAHSLEVREPLMDHPLVEWLATLPSSLKVRGGEGKCLLKKAMEPHLPRRRAVPAEDGLRRAARALVPRPAAAARARRGARRAAGRDRLVQPALPAAAGRRAPVAARATTARRCGRC